MSNFVYLANGDIFNMNIEHFNKIEHFTDVSDNIMTPTMPSTTMLPTMPSTIMLPTMPSTVMMESTMMPSTTMPSTVMMESTMLPTMTSEIMQPIRTSTIMTPEMRTEQQRLDETLLRSQNMEFELNTSMQNTNEAINQLMLNLTRN